jgi:hypothetical protein
MVFSASRFRSIFRRVPLLAIAGIAAVLAGLPSAAGATFLRPPDLARGGRAAGDSLSSRDLRLTVTDFRADLAERAARNLDFDRPGRLAFVDGFPRDRSRETRRDGAALDERASRIAAALALRQSHRRVPPQTVTPEPGTALLLAGGLAGLSVVGRKRR